MPFKSMRRNGLLLALFATVLAVNSPSFAQTNMSGSWALEVVTDQGTTTPELTLAQQGMTLTGSYSSATLGDSDVTGSVDGNNATVSFQANLQGQQVPVVYRGTVDGEGVWSGTIDIASGLLTGTFKGEKN